MKYTQKKNGNVCNFFLKRDEVEYSFKDKTTEYSFTIDYDDIPFALMKIKERNQWFRNVGVLWMIIGAYSSYVTYNATGSIKLSFWLILGFGCLVFYYLKQANFTVFETRHGRLFILEDKVGQEILDLIEDRRRQQFKERHAVIQWENNPEKEIERFRWMEEHGILTKEEFEEYKTRIQLSLDEPKMDSHLN